VTLVDSGTGNLFSLREAFRRTEMEVGIVRNARGIREAECLVLPGVASFPRMSRGIGPLRRELLASTDRRVPLLGICAGMQILFESSEEGPGNGLGLFPGRVSALRAPVVPHMGWSPVRRKDDPWFAGLPPEPVVYFAHSFAAPADSPGVVATAEHIAPFAAAIRRDALFGVQFHPEKSGPTGIAVLRGFLREAGVVPSS